MHEFSIAQSIIELAEDEARRAGAMRVTRLQCRIGVLRQIDNRLMRDAFELAAEGTLCDNADLDIEKTRVSLACPRCQQRFEAREWDWRCPECEADGEDPQGGDELELLSLEAEIEE
ncbi:MAG: hydrogenase maturation nickel metallochaperone HypA [Planctomycetes bacterium]|nr:hydrogenase maturation nickel metallochaperone HypA [Planctomycetota bacterium]